MIKYFLRLGLLVGAFLVFVPTSVTATNHYCPLCLSPGQTLSEAVSEADVVVLAQFTETIRKTPDADASGCVYQTVEVLKGNWKDKRIQIDRFEFGKPGDLFLLMGTLTSTDSTKDKPKATNSECESGKTKKVENKTTDVEWLSPRDVSELAFRYVQQAPPIESAGPQRMRYFLKFLESSDVTIANDAYAEFASAPYAAVVGAKDQFPREKLRRWIVEAQSKPRSPVKARSGLFAMMLGHCGDESDAKLLASFLKHTPKDDFPLGLDGIIAGFLLLKGESGLQQIEQLYVKDPATPIQDLISVRTALSFMWTYEPERFSKDRLRAALRPMLVREQLTTDIITDLARWEDWEAQDSLIELLKKTDKEEVRRNVMAYLLRSADVGSKSESRPESAIKAQAVISNYQQSEPKLVKEAEERLRRAPRP